MKEFTDWSFFFLPDFFLASVRERLKGRAIRTLIGLGRRLQSLDMRQKGILGKELLRECLMEELRLSQQVQ